MANRDQEVSPTGNDRGGQAPALRAAKISPFTVGRGTGSVGQDRLILTCL